MPRVPSRCSALALIFALLCGTVAPAAAQSSDTTGIIQIAVRSAATDQPLADARVFLVGPTVASALTNRSGIVKYTDVPSGLYRVRIGKSGFVGVMSAQFEVLGEKQVDVRVTLAQAEPRPGTGVAAQASPAPGTAQNTSGLKIIGTVKARVTVTTTDVDQNSAVRRISDSLLDALGTIGGVDVTQSSNDPDAPQTISLRGHDESQTAITLDGIPLGAPGSAVNMRGVNTDLFTGAGVSFGAQAGALGGSVNFRTLQPTLTWQSMFSGSYGTFDRYNYQLGETGSIGKLGIALLATKRAGNSPLTFQDFEDESGLTYPHGGENANIGDYVKLRYALTDRTTLMFTALQNNQAVSSLCTTDVTPFPCGIGPDNGTTGKFQFAYGTVQTLIGDTAITATTYVNSNRSFANDLARYQLGCPGEPLGEAPACGAANEVPVSNPFATRTSTLARGVAASATTTRDKHTITLSGSTYASTTAFTPLVGGEGFVTPGLNAVASRQVQLSDTIKANDKLSLGPNVSYAGTTGAGESILAGFSASWRPQPADTYNGSISVGSSQPAAGIIRSFSDPSSARVNCLAATAQVSGPGDQPARQFADSYDFGWTHQWAHGQFTFDTYRQIQGDQLINATLTADSLGLTDPSNPFYNAYYQAVVGYYGDVCPGSPAPSVFVSEPVGGTTRLYQGFTATANIGLGKNVVVIPSYTTTGASVIAADPRYLGYDSTLILGAQLPGRPVHTGNLTVDALYAPAQLEFLANAHYVGANNNQNIAPYVTVNAGISHPLGMGRITLFAANLFDTETGFFSTEQYAVPIPLSGGGELLEAARPNPPRSFTVTYSFNTGARPGAGFARGARGALAQTPSASPAPQRGFLGFGQLKFIAPPPGVDPLTIATSRPECTADLQSQAQAVLAELGAAAKAYGAGQPLPEVHGIAITPHGAPSTAWYFGLGPDIPESALPQRPPGTPNAGERRGGFGARGGPRGEGPGGPGGPPGGFQPEVTVQSPAGQNAPRPQFSPSPALIAAVQPFRALVSCSYGTVLTPAEAKADGYDVPPPGVRPSPAPSPAPGASPAPRGRRFGGNFIDYAPKIGIFVVRAPELGTGGGSVKQ